MFLLRRRRHHSTQRRAGYVRVRRERRVTDSPRVIQQIREFKLACARALVVSRPRAGRRSRSRRVSRSRAHALSGGIFQCPSAVARSIASRSAFLAAASSRATSPADPARALVVGASTSIASSAGAAAAAAAREDFPRRGGMMCGAARRGASVGVTTISIDIARVFRSFVGTSRASRASRVRRLTPPFRAYRFARERRPPFFVSPPPRPSSPLTRTSSTRAPQRRLRRASRT